MGFVAVTGSASGIGAAVAARLRKEGHDVIGVDLRGAEVIADLGTAEGRRKATEAVQSASRGILHGLVTCAGIAADIHPGPLVVSVNYFGTAELMDALRPALAAARGSSAIAISSNSTTVMPDVPDTLIEACLEGDEALARRLADGLGAASYAASKIAVARFVGRRAVKREWAGEGIRLNAIAPGRIRTPLDDALLAHERIRPILEAFPIPVGHPGQPEDVASLVAFLMGPEARFFCGSVVFVDGGSDALIRPDAWPSSYKTGRGTVFTS